MPAVPAKPDGGTVCSVVTSVITLIITIDRERDRRGDNTIGEPVVIYTV
jgi:hypothetical protein